MMLEVKNLHVYYGAIHALKGISFHVDKGDIVALIGANGAGKSTTLSTISGLFRDEDITMSPAEQTVQKGIVQVPEGRKIFATLTVIENLEMGAYTQRDKAQFKKDLENVFTIFPRLRDRQNQVGGTLSGGEQQMLAIARALMSNPSMLLLDEPSMGLSPILVEQIFEIVQNINKQGTSVLLVEQNAQMALSIADRAYVLETGEVTLEGNAQDVLHNPSVIEAYLGGH
jgi:branched-chain amino acid transport system ATP-binding protein